MRVFKRIYNGCRDIEGYGPHPGTMILVGYIIAAGLAATDKGGWNGFLGGMAIGAACLGPFYLWGAYSRGKLYERDQINLLKIIKDV